LVVDTAGFLQGYISIAADTKIYTVRGVLEEVRDPESRQRLELIEAAGKLEVREPGRESFEEVIRIAGEAGILEGLSKTDQELAALAAELRKEGYRVVIATDDSHLHTLAKRLGVESVGVRRSKPRSFKPRIYVCEVCGYTTKKRIDRCPSCGSAVKAI